MSISHDFAWFSYSYYVVRYTSKVQVKITVHNIRHCCLDNYHDVLSVRKHGTMSE